METQLTVYTADCVAAGEVRLDGDAERVRDALNAVEFITLVRAEVESLDAAARFCVPAMELQRGELLAVEVRTPRGPAGRRIHTVQHHVCLSLGPYTVVGQLHEKPGVPPLGSVRLSRPMVALTGTTIVHDRRGTHQVRRADTLVLNGSLVTWVRPADANTARLFGRGATLSADAR